MVKDIKFNEQDNVHDQILKGVEILSKSVKSTLGPRGRNVLIESSANSAPRITKDGVSVAKEVQLPSDEKHRFMNIGAQMVKEAASRTANKAGDGTTTSTVLAEAIYRKGLRLISSGCNSIEVKRGIDEATKQVIETLKSNAKPITNHNEIAQVATISANGDNEIGQLIADAMEKVGKDGVITVQESKSADTTLSVVEGMQFDKGAVSPFFFKEGQTEVVLEKPYILIHDKKISNIRDIMSILQELSQSNRALLIIAEDMDGECLPTMILNNIRGTLNAYAVKAPSYGESRKNILQDIAVLTGGKFISEDLGLKLDQTEVGDLGQANRVVITKDKTTIIEGLGDSEAIASRIEGIKKQVDESTSDYEKNRLKERLAKLSGGVAVISVGAGSEIELSEKKDRIDDALHATKAAVDSGILPGGGIALARASKSLESSDLIKKPTDSASGVEIVKEAIKLPLITICENGAISGEVVLNKVLENDSYSYGFDAREEVYCDMFEKGIIDPANVTITALESAASIAGMLLTTETVIANVPEENKSMAPGPMPGMM